MNSQPTLFSGIKPTGIPHIGNYLGALKQWVDLQNKYNCIYSIVDYHAITVKLDKDELQKNIYTTARILLSIGLDPNKSILFLQSTVPEHTELCWIFNCLTPVSELQRMTQFKDKAKQHAQNINAGLLDYPVLMAADILLYNAEFVPVGEDQLQHLELTRIIARKFNNRYHPFFVEPKPIVGQARRVMSLNNPNKKMSKDLGESSYISLLDPPEVVEKKIKRAVTDTGPADTNNMSAGVKNLFDLLIYFDNMSAYQKFSQEYKQGTIKYAELKQELANTINKYLQPIRTKASQITDEDIKQILQDGANKAKQIAQANINKIKQIIGTHI